MELHSISTCIGYCWYSAPLFPVDSSFCQCGARFFKIEYICCQCNYCQMALSNSRAFVLVCVKCLCNVIDLIGSVKSVTLILAF